MKRFFNFNKFSGTLFCVLLLFIYMRLYGSTIIVTGTTWLGTHPNLTDVLFKLHGFYFHVIEPLIILFVVRIVVMVVDRLVHKD